MGGGGVMTENPKHYDGGAFDYVDFCNVDMMSMLELGGRLKECGVLGCQMYYYKFPKTDWINGLWTLETDSDVLEMCELVPPSRLVVVFAVEIQPLAKESQIPSQSYIPSQDPDLEFVEAEYDRDFVREMFDEDGGYDENASYNDSDPEDEDYVVNQHDELSDDSFHSDSSNEESTDEDVAYYNYKKERAKKKVAKETAKATKEGKKAAKESKQAGKQSENAKEGTRKGW